MKNIINYINEQYSINTKPKTKEQLKQLIENRIKKEGPKCNLNDIDVSAITDMSYLFENSVFNGDIAMWDVSQVTNMDSMFAESEFNGNIAKWNVGNVENMESMFEATNFNGDISKWDVSNVKYMSFMFAFSDFNRDISMWNVSHVEGHFKMFNGGELEHQFNKQPKFKN